MVMIIIALYLTVALAFYGYLFSTAVPQPLEQSAEENENARLLVENDHSERRAA